MEIADTPKSWYSNLKYYLSTGNVLAGLDTQKHRAVHLKSARYQLVSRVLLRINFDNVLLRCLEKEESQKVLSSLHEGLAGGHFGVEVMTHNILKVGYYWLTLLNMSPLM